MYLKDMKIETADIWRKHHSEIYFFVLKKVKDEEATREIIQNVFLKIQSYWVINFFYLFSHEGFMINERTLIFKKNIACELNF